MTLAFAYFHTQLHAALVIKMFLSFPGASSNPALDL